MKERANEQSIRGALESYAAAAVPDDLDLWATIAGRLAARPVRRTAASLARAPWRARRLPLAMGTAALLLMILFAAGFPPGARRKVSAQEVLNDLAGVAVVQLAPHQPVNLQGVANMYRYTRSESTYLSMVAGPGERTLVALVPRSRQIWVAPDGSGRIREVSGEPIFLAERDRVAWEAAGSPPLGLATNQDFGPGELHYEDLQGLPTDPDALAAFLRQRADQPSGTPVEARVFSLVGDLLRESNAPPALRAALYKVLAEVAGVELVGHVTDGAGRPGVAVALTTDYGEAKQRRTLIFDPFTSALLGEEQVLLERVDWTAARPPVVIGRVTYLEAGVVTELE
ncbi:MAG: CU044_5270 family protein [Anaerolineae bacterium]